MADLDANAFLAPKIEHHACLTSTNDEAMRRAREGHNGGVWITADQQSGGRGRHGRIWASPIGNLYASLLLINPAPIAQTPEIGFVAGVALAQCLRGILGGDERLLIKWPNDMLFEGAKIAGLMLEGSTLADGRFALVIGIGVNCAFFPDNLAYRATCLSQIAKRAISSGEVLARLVREMNHWLALYALGHNFALVRQRWLSFAAGLGTRIEVDTGQRKVVGHFNTIDPRGRLVLDTLDGQLLIEAGDVFLPDAH